MSPRTRFVLTAIMRHWVPDTLDADRALSQQKQAQKPRKKVKAPLPGEVRKSTRLRGGDAQEHIDDDATQFAMFLIDGACTAHQRDCRDHGPRTQHAGSTSASHGPHELMVPHLAPLGVCAT